MSRASSGPPLPLLSISGKPLPLSAQHNRQPLRCSGPSCGSPQNLCSSRVPSSRPDSEIEPILPTLLALHCEQRGHLSLCPRSSGPFKEVRYVLGEECSSQRRATSEQQSAHMLQPWPDLTFSAQLPHVRSWCVFVLFRNLLYHLQ